MKQTFFTIHNKLDWPLPSNETREPLAAGFVLDYPTLLNDVSSTVAICNPHKPLPHMTEVMPSDFISKWYFANNRSPMGLLAYIFGWVNCLGDNPQSWHAVGNLNQCVRSNVHLAFAILMPNPGNEPLGNAVKILKSIDTFLDSHVRNAFNTMEEIEAARKIIWSDDETIHNEFMSYMLEGRGFKLRTDNPENSPLTDKGHFYHLLVKMVLAEL